MKSVEEYRCEHGDLMQRWKDQYPDCIYFTEDGIVNFDEWSGMPEDQRIVFLLKEAYTGENQPSDWNEARWLNGEHCREHCAYKGECAKRCRIKGYSFNRIAEWTYCITELSDGRFLRDISAEELSDHIYWLGVYDEKKRRKENNAAYRDKRAELLRKIAVVNLKKADGQKSSDAEDIAQQVKTIRKLLLDQLKLIQPYYVVCGGTWSLLGKELQDELSKNYRVIRTPHPNARIARAKLLQPVLECLRENNGR